MPLPRKAIYLIPILTLVFFAWMSIGCGSDDPLRFEDETSQFKVVHASPDAGQIDILWDQSIVLEDVPYRVSSGYLETTANSHSLGVVPTGVSTPLLIDDDFLMAIDNSYSIVVTGLLAQNDLQAMFLIDNRKSIPERANVRFVNVSPDAGALDLAFTGGAVLFSNVGYRGATNYVELAGGKFNMELRATGTTTVVLPMPNTPMFGSLNYTYYVIGEVGNGTLRFLSVRDVQ